MKKNTYNIGEISKICNVPISKLRYYDKIGVITPAFVDDDTGYRYYDNDTILQLSILKYHQCSGFTLKDIQNLLQCLDLDHLEPMFTRQIAELEKHIQVLHIQRDTINAYLKLIYKQKEISKLSEIPIRHRYFRDSVLYVSKPYLCKDMSYKMLVSNIEMNSHLTSTQSSTIGPLYIYFPHVQQRDDLESAKLYIRPHPLEIPMTTREIILGTMTLSTYHKGKPDTMVEAYDRIYEYADRYGIELRGDTFECSVIDWWSTKKEEEFLFEIIMPTTETPPSTLKINEIYEF